jgi:hypothetical protein
MHHVLRQVLCLMAGFAIVGGITVDIAWTTLGTHGGGPISGPITAAIWKTAVRLHKKYPHDRALSFAGSFIVLVLLAFWTTTLWLGWFTVFSARRDSIEQTQTHQAGGAVARLYYTGSTVATLGSTDYVARGTGWRVLAVVAALGGLGTLTLAVTFLLQVLSSVVQERQLAAYITDLGATPREILRRSWTGVRFDGLAEHVLELTRTVQGYTEMHLAYPVLHYYHSESERTSATLRLAALSELSLLLCHGVAEEAQLPPMVTWPLERALNGFAKVICGEFLEPAATAPPPPDLNMMRTLGIPTVDDAAFALAVAEADETRRFWAGLIDDDGRKWERVNADEGSADVSSARG